MKHLKLNKAYINFVLLTETASKTSEAESKDDLLPRNLTVSIDKDYVKLEEVADVQSELDIPNSELEKQGLVLLSQEDLDRIEKRFEKRRDLLTEQCKLQKNKAVTRFEGMFKNLTPLMESQILSLTLNIRRLYK